MNVERVRDLIDFSLYFMNINFKRDFENSLRVKILYVLVTYGDTHQWMLSLKNSIIFVADVILTRKKYILKQSSRTGLLNFKLAECS